jgi:NhaA family Na+:H+ antiporter
VTEPRSRILPAAASLLASKIRRPIERFFEIEAASGVLLLAATILALIWANSPWRHLYEAIWDLPFRLSAGAYTWEPTLHFVVNDGLMTIFFLVVGLEIRRELHDGALADLRAAVVPLAAAVGGILLPALIYLALASQNEIRRGWAVPTATDIAFAIGVLTLLGKRVPPAVRVLLLTLAIIDDVAAILVIAFFYSGGIDFSGLAIVALGIALVFAFQRLHVRSAFAYVLPGALVWAGLLQAGVHPTLTGVILGLLTPVGREALSPVVRVELALHPWVAYGIMPLFALANAGVEINGWPFAESSDATLTAAIVCGLALGKPLGILAFTWLVTKSGLGALAPGVSWRGVLLVGCLGGIGFTMSLFLATLAFDDPSLLATAKLAILLGSGAAGIGGLLLGRYVLFKEPSSN